ncbi:36342_t:CDS:2, partial [Gigaspora margarita]
MYYDDEDIVDRMMQILEIKQGNKESVEEFTKHYDSCRQYLYEVESLLSETYNQAKQLALIVEAQMKVKSLDGRDDIGWCYQYGIGTKRRNKKSKWFVKDEENNDKGVDQGIGEEYYRCQHDMNRDAELVIERSLNISVVYNNCVMVVIRIKWMLWYDVVKEIRFRCRIFVCNNLGDRGRWIM